MICVALAIYLQANQPGTSAAKNAQTSKANIQRETNVPCKTPPLMPMTDRAFSIQKGYISSIARFHTKECSTDAAHQECATNQPCQVTTSYIPNITILVYHISTPTLAHVRGGIELSSLSTSLAAIWLFCKLRTWLPLRNRCRPSASFQLSDSSMRNTYFLPSASRTEARRI